MLALRDGARRAPVVIDADLAILRAAAGDRGRDIVVTVSGCAYSCCGRGWTRRDGYEQRYVGYVDNFDGREPGAFMLYSRGIGTISYVCAIRFGEVEAVEWP